MVAATTPRPRDQVNLLYWFARRLAGPLDVNDLVAEAFVLLGRRETLYDPARNGLSTWVKYAVLTARNRIVRRDRPGADPLPDEPADDRPRRSRTPDPSEAAERQELLALLADRFGRLADADRDLLTRRFGLDGYPPAKLDELAAGRGVTRERARQRVAEAVGRLRVYMGPVAVRERGGAR